MASQQLTAAWQLWLSCGLGYNLAGLSRLAVCGWLAGNLAVASSCVMCGNVSGSIRKCESY